MMDQTPPPDRLSVSPNSPFYDAAVLARGVGVRFRGEVRTTVEEYCISEGWIKVAAGKARDRRGELLLVKLNGPVEVWFEDEAGAPQDS